MTQVFTEAGNAVPVTVIDLGGSVVAKKDNEKVLLGAGKKGKINKSFEGQYKELGFVPKKVMEVDAEGFSESNVGDKVSLEILKNTEYVDITGVSKGKGFAGVVKRWGFHGGPKTHGQSDRNRAPGSIGAGTSPGRVVRGMKMGGRLGGDTITVKNLKVVSFDETNNLLLVKGAVPGVKDSIVVIKVK